MSQSQRWGKVVTTMPVPGGEITTSEILKPVVEEYNEDVAAYEAAVAEASEKAKNDLPELS
jgi:hypothetical protein